MTTYWGCSSIAWANLAPSRPLPPPCEQKWSFSQSPPLCSRDTRRVSKFGLFLDLPLPPPCKWEWAFGVPIQKQNEKLSMSEPSINQNHLRSMCSMPELPSLVELFPSPLHVHWLFQYIQYILFNIYVSSHLWLANVDICNEIILASSCWDSTAPINEGACGANVAPCSSKVK